MNELNNLASIGLTLPSPIYFIGSLVFGIVGYVLFRRGRKTTNSVLTWGGVALMVYPMFTTETWVLWAIGVILCLWLYGKWE